MRWMNVGHEEDLVGETMYGQDAQFYFRAFQAVQHDCEMVSTHRKSVSCE